MTIAGSFLFQVHEREGAFLILRSLPFTAWSLTPTAVGRGSAPAQTCLSRYKHSPTSVIYYQTVIYKLSHPPSLRAVYRSIEWIASRVLLASFFSFFFFFKAEGVSLIYLLRKWNGRDPFDSLFIREKGRQNQTLAGAGSENISKKESGGSSRCRKRTLMDRNRIRWRARVINQSVRGGSELETDGERGRGEREESSDINWRRTAGAIE